LAQPQPAGHVCKLRGPDRCRRRHSAREGCITQVLSCGLPSWLARSGQDSAQCIPMRSHWRRALSCLATLAHKRRRQGEAESTHVGVGVIVFVGVDEAVRVGVGVDVPVGVEVDVLVGVGVDVVVGVEVDVLVGVGVDVLVGLGDWEAGAGGSSSPSPSCLVTDRTSRRCLGASLLTDDGIVPAGDGLRPARADTSRCLSSPTQSLPRLAELQPGLGE